MAWKNVYELVKRIPRGRVITYGQIAQALRLPGGARAAGWAIAACPAGRGIPWHRVVGAGGKLLIPEPYASMQRKLLAAEGVQLRESRLDIAHYGWRPGTHPTKSALRARRHKRRARAKRPPRA